MTPPLLPIAKGGYTHSDHQRKLVLRFLELLSNRLHIFRPEHKFALLRTTKKRTSILPAAAVGDGIEVERKPIGVLDGLDRKIDIEVRP